MSRSHRPREIQASRRPIVCVSLTEWDGTPHNSRHLMVEARRRGHSVLYVNPIGMRTPKLRQNDLRKIGRRLNALRRFPLRAIDDAFTVLSPVAVPFQGTIVGDRINGWMLARQIQAAVRRLSFSRPIVWTYMPQMVVPLQHALGPAASIYYRTDDYSALEGVRGSAVRRWEREAVSSADLCIAAAERFLTDALAGARRALWVQNAADLEVFHRCEGPDPYMFPRPRLLWLGTLEHWVDLQLLVQVAEGNPDWHIVLAGENKIDLSLIRSTSNIHYIGLVPYEELGRYCTYADAGLMPFRLNEQLREIRPGKLFQYFAGGLPIVSTRFLDPKEFERFIFFADNEPTSFSAAVERSLAAKDGLTNQLRKIAEQHSWSARFDEIENALSDHLQSEAAGMGC